MAIDWSIMASAFFASLPATIAALTAAWRSRRTEKSVNGKMEEVQDLVSQNATAHATLAERKRNARIRTRLANQEQATRQRSTQRRDDARLAKRTRR